MMFTDLKMFEKHLWSEYVLRKFTGTINIFNYDTIVKFIHLIYLYTLIEFDILKKKKMVSDKLYIKSMFQPSS